MGDNFMADTNIKYNDHSISSAFKDHYIVPDYQREYVWEEKQVEQLLADLLEAYEADSKKAYFLGTIVTYDSGSQFELIDGQQRLTTFFLMLCVIKHLYHAKNESTDLIENLIFSPTMDPDGNTIHSYHLQLQYEDAGNCLELIEKGQGRPKNLTDSGERLFNAVKVINDFLVDKFSDLAQLKKFVYFLLYVTSFVRIETHDITDALKIFETINQRGKGLDPMDLLKNMVFRQVNRSKFEKLNLKWKEITSALESIEEKPLRFLRYFIMANYNVGKVKDGVLREDQIYNWLHDNNDQCRYEEEPFQFVDKMRCDVARYVQFQKPQDNLAGNVHLKNVKMLAGNSYKLHLMLLLAASNMDDDALARFKEVIESIVYCTVINRITTNITERTFASWCGEIRKITNSEELDKFVSKSVLPVISGWRQDNQSNFMRLGLNSMQQYRIKFILAKITAYVDALRQGTSSVSNVETYLQNTVDIEHIMPQSCPDTAQYGVTEEEFPVYRDRLGNLTLLESSINKSIQNDAYDEKVKAYKQSKFYLTSALSELVDQGTDTAINRTNKLLRSWKTWDKNSIEDRQLLLYEISEKIWGISRGGAEQTAAQP
jgi:uncharacterized protein with ParB-like and HNH nuclease domain